MCNAQFKRDKMFGILLVSFLSIGDAHAHQSEIHHERRRSHSQKPRAVNSHRWVWVSGRWEIRNHRRVWIRGYWRLQGNHHHGHNHRHCR